MGNPNLLPSQRVAILATIDPEAQGAETVISDYIDASKFENYMFIIQVGTLGSSATVDAKVQQCTQAADAGSDVKDITGKAITQLTQAGTDADKQVIINVAASEMDIANGFKYLVLSLTVGTAECDVSAVVLGLDPKYGPANESDLASVDEIIA